MLAHYGLKIEQPHGGDQEGEGDGETLQKLIQDEMELESNELSERPVDLGFINTLAKAGLTKKEDVSRVNLMYRWAEIRDTVRMDTGKVRNAFSRLCSIMCAGIRDTDAG